LERKNSKNTSIILSFCVRHRIIVNNLEKKVISQKKKVNDIPKYEDKWLIPDKRNPSQ